MTAVVPSLRPDSIPSWASRVRDAQALALPGTGLQVGPDFVLWRNRCGHVVGVLGLDPHGGFVVHVDPVCRRRGIASRLLDAACTRWPLDLEAERYTPDGAAWINAYRQREARK